MKNFYAKILKVTLILSYGKNVIYLLNESVIKNNTLFFTSVLMTYMFISVHKPVFFNICHF